MIFLTSKKLKDRFGLRSDISFTLDEGEFIFLYACAHVNKFLILGPVPGTALFDTHALTALQDSLPNELEYQSSLYVLLYAGHMITL